MFSYFFKTWHEEFCAIGKTVDEAMSGGIEGIITPGLKGNSVYEFLIQYIIMFFFMAASLKLFSFFYFLNIPV